MNKDLEIRKTVLETLIQAEKSNIMSHVMIRDVLDKYDYLSQTEKAIISKIIKGVIERRIELDYVLDIYSKTKCAKMKLPIRTILEMGVYQILYMDSYDTLAVNTSVDLAKKKGFSSLSGYVNAVLRNVVRNKENIPYPSKDSDNYLSVKYSVPQFLVNLILSQYDFETAEKIFKASLESDCVKIRIKEGLSEEEKAEVIKELKSKNAEINQVFESCDLYSVKGAGSLSGLKTFKEGKFYVQDTGSYILCKNVPFGEKILDACSAPGGKSIFLSERFPESLITACDISEDKTEKINENIKRCRAKNIKTLVADASVNNPEWNGYFDVVLADVPCSGLGVMGKKQDIKYNLSEDGLRSLYELQKSILLNISKYVKKGGYLVYSTCTINKAENEYLTDEFVKESDFEYETPNFLPEELKESCRDGRISLLQGVNESDGFYISLMKRN
ncbi:MAG: 16S rRNA (cytosine(967)-C(5))-methyltransferase RsmB [Lachnospiraceae bacterium]|nr:16S rRNA (cytosine(967)-C(5))-methyltransferase RsmB [Lachnospiraceae bacterium]